MNANKRRLSIWLIALALASNAQSPTENYSIKACLEYAAEHSSQLKVAKYNEDIAMQQTNEVVGRALPQANINGTWEDKLKVPLLIIPGGFGGAASTGPGSSSTTPTTGEATKIRMGYQFNTSVVGEVTQMIVDPAFGVGLKAAKQSAVLYKQQSQQVSEKAVYNIASAYYQSVVLQKQLAYLQSNLVSTQRTLATTELKLKNGVAKQVDVSRLRVNANNLQSQIRQTELSLKQALNTLKFQMGMPLSQPIYLTDTSLVVQNEERALAEGSDDYTAQRIDYKLLETNLRLQQLDKANHLRGYFPSLTAFANYGYQAQGPDFGFVKMPSTNWVEYTTSSIGLRLRVPIFDGLQRNARVQQSKLKIDQIEENLTLSKQTIGLEVANAMTQYRNTLERIEAEGQNVQLAEEVYQVTQLEFKEGVSTSLDLITAETSLRQAQNTYTQTLLNLYTARLDVERAKGNLSTYFNK